MMAEMAEPEATAMSEEPEKAQEAKYQQAAFPHNPPFL